MSRCLDYALKYIHTYPKTVSELTTKLHTKGYSENDISFTCDFLQQKGYLNDTLFTELYVESELVKKGKTPQSVKNKLIHKGVDKKIINEVMAKKEKEIEVGIATRIKKEIEKLKKKGLDGYDIVVKLTQKGYSYKEIKKTLQTEE